jgi:hypothetical protein
MWGSEPVKDSKFDSSVWPIPPSTPELSILKNVRLAADLLLLSLADAMVSVSTHSSFDTYLL